MNLKLFLFFPLSICCLSYYFFVKAIGHYVCAFPLMKLNIFFTVFFANCAVSLFHQFFSFFSSTVFVAYCVVAL